MTKLEFLRAIKEGTPVVERAEKMGLTVEGALIPSLGYLISIQVHPLFGVQINPVMFKEQIDTILTSGNVGVLHVMTEIVGKKWEGDFKESFDEGTTKFDTERTEEEKAPSRIDYEYLDELIEKYENEPEETFDKVDMTKLGPTTVQ